MNHIVLNGLGSSWRGILNFFIIMLVEIIEDFWIYDTLKAVDDTFFILYDFSFRVALNVKESLFRTVTIGHVNKSKELIFIIVYLK